MRLSTARSMPEEDEEARAPPSSGSSLTQGNLDHMTASVSAAGKPPPSPSGASQPAGSFVTGQQHTQEQQQQPSPKKNSQPGSSLDPLKQQTHQQQQQQKSLLKSQTVTSSAQQAVDVHPLQQPAATSTQQGSEGSQQAGTSDGMQAQDQSPPGTAAPAGDGEGMSGGPAFGAWASAEQHSDWAVMEWVATEALPTLVGTVRMVGPHTETEALRYLPCYCFDLCMSVHLSICLSVHLSICICLCSLCLLLFVLFCICFICCLAVDPTPEDHVAANS